MASHPTPPRPRGPQKGQDPRGEQPQTTATPGAGTTRAGAPSSAAKTARTGTSTSRSTSTKRGTLAARPTEARIQSYLATVHPLPGSETRPTESQLRWAAFHSKSKARYTRSLVEALMVRPAGVGDVPGALEGDGDTTEESCSSEGSGGSSAEGEDSGGLEHRVSSSEAHSNGNLQQKHGTRSKTNNNKKKKKKRRKKKRRPGQPDLSRGRRATLRVSERATDRRRRDNARNGYRSGRGLEGGSTEFASRRKMFDTPPPPPPGAGAKGLRYAYGQQNDAELGESNNRAVGDAEATTVHADVLAEAFGEEFYSPNNVGGGSGDGGVASHSPSMPSASATPGSSNKRGATNQGRTQTASTARFTQDLDEDDEARVKRFEAALSALKISTEATSDDQPVKDAGKRWTRPTNVATGATQSPFFDIQRGGSYRYGSVHSPPNAAAAGGRGASTFDRGASWLVHMPKVATGSADRRKGAAELQDKGASWLSHVPRATPRYRVDKGRLIISPTDSNGEQVESPELQDRVATWMEHMPNREDRLATERAAAAASRSLKVDVTAEASRSPEKVQSPGEAKFNDIISQFHSIEAMLAAQREGEHVPGAAAGTHRNEPVTSPVTSPAMSQMNVLQAALAANDMAAGKQRTPKGKNPLSPMSCLLYTSPSPRDISGSRMPSSA